MCTSGNETSSFLYYRFQYTAITRKSYGTQIETEVNRCLTLAALSQIQYEEGGTVPAIPLSLNVINVPSTYSKQLHKTKTTAPSTSANTTWLVFQTRVGQCKFQQRSSSSDYPNRIVRSPQQPRTAQKL